MPASPILLLNSDLAAGQAINATLSAAGYAVTQTAVPDEAIAGAPDHALLIIDHVSGPRSAIDICREIRTNPAMTGVPIVCVGTTDDVEERIGFLEAGADDVMARPFDSRELEARVEALLLRYQRSKDLGPVVSADGLTLARAKRVVVVYSPKGGVGTTTIAANVAVVQALRQPDKVVLVDLQLQFGNVAAHLNIEPKQTIADVIRDEAPLREPELLRTYAVRHDSGLHILAAPIAPETAEGVTSTHVGQLLRTLLESYDRVVIDAGSRLDERTMTMFDAAETVILPVYPEIAALNAMHALLEFLGEADAVGSKSLFVINSLFAREILKLRDIESALGARVSIELPYDPFIYVKAVNEGVPVVLGAAKSAAADRLTKLSRIAFADDGVIVPPPADEKKSGGGLFRRRH